MADFKTKTLEEQMKGKTRCTKCGKILSDKNNFYTSNSKLHTYTGRLSLCKSCLNNFYISLLEETNDIRIAIFKLCELLDFVYLENIYESSLIEAGWNKKFTIVENGLEVWKKYIKTINSLTNYQGLTFEHGDKINNNNENNLPSKEVIQENTTIVEKKKELTENDLEQKIRDKQNKEDIIRIIGYDPFENELEEDKSKMYAKLINMLDEDSQNDELKNSAIISIIKGQNQENKINDVITILSSDAKSIKDNIGTIKSLTDTKEKLNKSLLALAKDNKISDLYSGHKTVGANTLTGMVKKLKEIDLSEAQVNLFDIQTSMGMLQTARLSAQAQIENLNFGDDDLVDMVKFQRGKIDFYEQEYSKLREENRKLKAICSFNDVDYKQEVLETEFYDVLDYGNLKDENISIQKQKYENELNMFNEITKNIKPITTMEYIDEVIEEKKNIEKQKILNDVIKE
jgi:Fe-S oxidoreductase